MARFRGLKSSFFCKRTDPVLMGQPEQTAHFSFGFMHLPKARELISFGFTLSTPSFYYCSSVTARGAFYILSRQTVQPLLFSPRPQRVSSPSRSVSPNLSCIVRTYQFIFYFQTATTSITALEYAQGYGKFLLQLLLD